MTDHALVWFRSDLRGEWNLALDQAKASHKQITAIYINTPEQWQGYGWSTHKKQFIDQRLQHLSVELREQGIGLQIHDFNTYHAIPEALQQFCENHAISHLYFNREYEWDERQRDKRVKAALNDVRIQVFDDSVLVPPQDISTLSGQPYQKFTPYFHAWRRYLGLDRVEQNVHPQDFSLSSQSMGQQAKPPTNPVHTWPTANTTVQQRWRDYLQHKMPDYAEQRDYMCVSGTSQLAVYFNLGVLGGRQLLKDVYDHHAVSEDTGAYAWILEFAWRDFYRYIAFHFPWVCKHQCFNRFYQHFPWRQDRNLFESWCEGKTGYPIVDAAMRCLNETGWMHNRLRMLCASFLCKHLLLPWQWGESYFMAKLLDGDFCSNNGGWQWSASTGVDAAPYFRIFNPFIQSKKYDAQGYFIRQWCPELTNLDKKSIHQPQDSISASVYPRPIVDHKQATQQTKALFSEFLHNAK
jgi:deoxyribodipyrimidine photo-lyase